MLGALAPLVSPLSVGERCEDGHWVSVSVVGESRLVIGPVADRDDMTRFATAPSNPASLSISRSVAAGRCAVVASRTGQVGVDIETIARIELNATAQDGWLTAAERSLVDRAADPGRELICHWVLKEAYGKALGVGLALPLDQLVFASRAGGIVLAGAAAPPRRRGWSYRLHRYQDLIVAVAYRPERQAATPFAPAGRKPPTPLLDR